VKKEDIQKIVFRTRYGHYEFLVMPFRSDQCPSSLYGFDEPSFLAIFGSVFIVFMDIILIYSKSDRELSEHLRIVLQTLQLEQLQLSRASVSSG